MIASLLVAALLSGSGNASLAAAWKARGERATQKLSKPGLDACDRAVELAFQTAKVSGTDDAPMYVLTIRINDEVMFAGYTYKGSQLADFSVMALPPKWMAHQTVERRTLSVVLGNGPKCAFDLCPTDPFSDGPCAAPSR